MDFELSEDQASMAELAATILGDLATPDALRAHERSGEPVLRAAWRALADADLLALALTEAVGGGGYGVLEAALVAEQVGRHVAPVPYAATTAAAIALGDHEAVRGVATGERILAPALGDGAVEVTTGRLTGTLPAVPWAAEAAGLLVAAGGGLHLLDPTAEGVVVTPERTMWGLPQATVELAAAPAEQVGGAEAATRLEHLAVALVCATVSGVCEGALRTTAAYVSERQQFGAPIGTFQAVAQRMADAYIDTQGVHLTALQAAWRLSVGLPAAEELHIAKFWAADAGHRVVHAAQHLHGGIGMDLDYPIHRYFRWAKVLGLQLGSATDHLRRLGALLAATPA